MLNREQEREVIKLAFLEIPVCQNCGELSHSFDLNSYLMGVAFAMLETRRIESVPSPS
jgi:hypothetical protein